MANIYSGIAYALDNPDSTKQSDTIFSLLTSDANCMIYGVRVMGKGTSEWHTARCTFRICRA